MICAISDEVPEDPVLSKSGMLYERRLIERYIEDHAMCPVTKEELTMDDLVRMKTNKVAKPRPLQAASVPGLLGMFQNEWDALMLSNFALEQQLHTARQELSYVLYQHDAACRVIARPKKERDEARTLLAEAERQIPISAGEVAPVAVVTNGKRDEVGPDGKKLRPDIYPVMIDKSTECNSMLSAQRRKRQVPPSLAPIDALERYTPISSHPLHKTNKPGILSTDIYHSKGIIATEGIDTDAVLLIGRLLKSCARSLVTQKRQTFKDHAAEVEAVTVHATQKYFVSEASGQEGYTSAAFHPDGLILGIGTSEAVVKIWDVKTQSNVAKFDRYVGPVTAMSFSENGYFLATAALDGVKLWDLRKLRNFRTISVQSRYTNKFCEI